MRRLRWIPFAIAFVALVASMFLAPADLGQTIVYVLFVECPLVGLVILAAHVAIEA